MIKWIKCKPKVGDEGLPVLYRMITEHGRTICIDCFKVGISEECHCDRCGVLVHYVCDQREGHPTLLACRGCGYYD